MIIFILKNLFNIINLFLFFKMIIYIIYFIVLYILIILKNNIFYLFYCFIWIKFIIIYETFYCIFFCSVFLYLFRWILLNPLSRPGEGYIITLQKCQHHFSVRILIFLFLFQEFGFLSAFCPAFHIFIILPYALFLPLLFILFRLPFPVRFLSMPSYVVQFFYSFPFRIFIFVSGQVFFSNIF